MKRRSAGQALQTSVPQGALEKAERKGSIGRDRISTSRMDGLGGHAPDIKSHIRQRNWTVRNTEDAAAERSLLGRWEWAEVPLITTDFSLESLGVNPVFSLLEIICERNW